MTKIIQEKLEDKLNNLTEIYQGLKTLQKLQLKDLEKNIEKVWAVAFGLIAGIEAILDISQYILANQNIKIESYSKIPEKLFEAEVISKDFSEKLQQMIGFRNRAIHNYPSLEPKRLYEILQKDIDDFKKFLKIVNKLE